MGKVAEGRKRMGHKRSKWTSGVTVVCRYEVWPLEPLHVWPTGLALRPTSGLFQWCVHAVFLLKLHPQRINIQNHR